MPTDTKNFVSIDNIIQLILMFECTHPGLLNLAKASKRIREAVLFTSATFNAVLNFRQCIAKYERMGWFTVIKVEQSFDFKIAIILWMNNDCVEKRINSFLINQELYKESSVYRNAVIEASSNMMNKYEGGEGGEEDLINGLVRHFEKLGECYEMFDSRCKLSRNTIQIVHRELWKSILADLVNSRVCFSYVKLRNNNLQSLPHNLLNIARKKV